MFKKPPQWQSVIAGDFFTRITQSKELKELMKRAQREYLYWDPFRHKKMPVGFKPEEAWAALKIERLGGREPSPVITETGGTFSFITPNALHEILNFIDMRGQGIQTPNDEDLTRAIYRELTLSGMTEEAIASSQIEGASTTRKVAKAMIRSGREPRTLSEQMILNNFKTMQRLVELADVEMNEEILCELQAILTTKTDIEADEIGRFRTEEEEIFISDDTTGEIVFTPPAADFMRKQLTRLITFANTDNLDGEFMHPIVKASILHFWIAYLHPFTDGNGRTARAVSYWYLMKHGYPIVQFASVSRAIRVKRANYDKAYMHAEHDEFDLTYFIMYVADAIKRAIEVFEKEFTERIEAESAIRGMSDKLIGINNRQIALLRYLLAHPDEHADITSHQNTHGVAYDSARNDLLELVQKGYLTKMNIGRKFVFAANRRSIKALFA